MTLYLLGGMVVVSIALIVYSIWPESSEQGEAVKRRISGKRGQDAVAAIRQQAKESVTKKVMETVAPITARRTTQSAEEMSKLRIRLSMGGFRSDTAPMTFLASKAIMALLFGIAGLTWVMSQGYTAMNAVGVTLMACGAGFLAPDLWLGSAISKRKESIRHGLPDTLDLMVITVESGLGLDAAFQRVGDEMKHVHIALAEELQLVTLEGQMGIPRSEALSNLASRTGVDEARSLVAIINQAERFGTSIARALRNQSDALRMKRRQAAEERAQKTTVKLMAPLILFIFPAILVVLAGPAALKMIETLGNTPGLL